MPVDERHRGVHQDDGVADALRVSADDPDDRRQQAAADGEDEEGESAFVELVEYVRVSVQLIYDETAALRKEQSAGGNA